MSTKVGRNDDSYDEEKKGYYSKVMDILRVKLRNQLIFSGIVQDGKLLDYRKGEREDFALPPPSQDALDVKLSLVMDLAKTLDGVIGSPKIITIQFQNHDLVIMGISQRSFMYTLSLTSSAQAFAAILSAVRL